METRTKEAVPVERKKEHRKQRLVVMISPDQRIILEGVDSTIDAVLKVFTWAHRRFLAAKRQGIGFPTAAAICRDQAMR